MRERGSSVRDVIYKFNATSQSATLTAPLVGEPDGGVTNAVAKGKAKRRNKAPRTTGMGRRRRRPLQTPQSPTATAPLAGEPYGEATNAVAKGRLRKGWVFLFGKILGCE